MNSEDEKLSQSKRNGSSSFPCGMPNPPELDKRDQNSLQDKSTEKHSFVYSGSKQNF